MNTSLRVGILGAGLGSRLKSSASAKPLAEILPGLRLLDLLLQRFLEAGAAEIRCALRAELMPEELRARLPRIPAVHYLFVDTPSSLHTLGELARSFSPGRDPVLFSMADSVLLPEDFRSFLRSCRELPPDFSSVLLSRYVDDEKPLWARIDTAGNVLGFGSEQADAVSSGMYFLSRSALTLAEREIAGGTHKMRNFLSKLVDEGHPVKSFVVNKTIDVDHPSDLQKAAEFLRTQQG